MASSYFSKSYQLPIFAWGSKYLSYSAFNAFILLEEIGFVSGKTEILAF